MRAGERIATRTGTRRTRPIAGGLPLGDVQTDTPSSTALGFEILVTGVLSQTATATLEYTPVGGAYVRGPDLLRVRPDLGNDVDRADAFAGMLWDLTPGTTYDIRIIVTEGLASKSYTFQQATRDLAPEIASPPSYVISEGMSQAQAQTILDSLIPGDIVEFRGRHNYSGLVINDGTSGTAADPIILRGDNRDSAIVGDNSETPVITVRGSHVVIQDLTLQGHQTTKYIGVVRVDGRTGTVGRSPIRGFTLRRCKLFGKFGVRLWEGSVTQISDVDIYQNNITGVWSWQDIITKKGDGTIGIDTWDDSGIQITGQGHSVFNNTLSGYGDAIKVHRDTSILNTTQCLMRNKVLWSTNDCIELDDAYRNCVAYQNHLSNSGTGVSKQPNFVTGGPNYIVRNVCANQFIQPFKLNDGPNGVLLVHNTIVETQNDASDPSLNSTWIQYGPADPGNTFILNNLWTNANPIGDRHIWFDGAYLADGQFDGSGYYPDLSFSFQNQLNPPAGNVTRANFLAAQNEPAYPDGYAGGGFENAGEVLAAQPFAAGIGQFGADWTTRVNDFDERLDAGSSAASGAINLPGYNSVSRGALNQGSSRPQYGAWQLLSLLEEAAASLAKGQSVALPTSNLVQSAIWRTPDEATNFMQWGNTAVWSTIQGKVEWIGKRESNAYHYHRLTYDESTNTWSQSDNLHPNALVNQSGHGYDLTALDPATGDIYHRRYNQSIVEHWTRATDSWSTIPNIPGSVDIAEALEWWPGRGLVYSDVYGVRLWNGSAWATIVPGSAYGAVGYHSFGEYQPNANVYCFGGGNNAPTTVYRVDASNAITLLGASPIALGNGSSGQAVLVHDPANNNYITWGSAGNTWYRFNPLTDTWTLLPVASGSGATPEIGAPNFPYNANGSLAVAIPDYSVMMFFTYASDTVWLYKSED